VRIIAGKLKGRNFDSPNSFKTHPMSDKIRGALFNVLGDIEGLTFLDAFAGSGALAFEAVSRGAESVIAIDSDRLAQKIIAENSRALGVDKTVKLVKASANAWLQTNLHTTFDIVLCDPPYNDLQPNLLQRLAQRVDEDGLLVLSWPGDQDPPELEGMQPIEFRKYGDASLTFYRPHED
jgi:16S rRNA (guanine966-N2)-methyltransferase